MARLVFRRLIIEFSIGVVSWAILFWTWPLWAHKALPLLLGLGVAGVAAAFSLYLCDRPRLYRWATVAIATICTVVLIGG